MYHKSKVMETVYNTYTLENGLRVIHRPSASPVVYCGYGICAGTRDERPGDEGLAHFCEHISFKGTSRRSAMQILNGLESVGGSLNAFTNKENTFFFAAIMREHLSKAVSLLTDIVFDGTYPQNEIEREIAVIRDEIESYNDSPAELIFDEFENIIFKNHPLGHNILGSPDRIGEYTTAEALSFVSNLYTPANAVFFAYGDIDFDRLVARLKAESAKCRRHAAFRNTRARPEIGGTPAGTFIEQPRSTHQTHVMIGRRAYSAYDERRIPLFLLNNLLGGTGMNARLNVSLRERNGLVYTVESSAINYSDTGLWAVYFGCDHGDVKKCLSLTRRELDRMMQKALSPGQLEKIKRQTKGQIGIACDSREAFALDFAKSYLQYGRLRDIGRLCERIDSVSAAQIQDVAQELFNPDTLTTLVFR